MTESCFADQMTRVSQKSLVPGQTSFAPVQPYVAPMQPAFCSIVSKKFLRPSKTFWARSAGLTSVLGSLICNFNGLPNANAKSQRFSYVISQIAPLAPWVATNRSFKLQIAARYAAFSHAVPQIALASFF